LFGSIFGSVTSLTGRITLGGASFSIDLRDRSWNDDVATVRHALDAGVSMVDSARAYAQADDPAHNERLLAEAVASRSDVLIATKGGHFRSSDYGWSTENTPERLRADVDSSLQNLRVDCLDLFYVHRMDAGGDLSAIMAELDALRSSGKVARVGLSNVTATQLREAVSLLDVDAVQNRHSASALDSLDVLRVCEEHGIPFFAYSPVRPTRDSTISGDFPELSAVCDERGVSVYTALLAILLGSSPVISVVTGASRPSSIDDSVAAAHLAADDELLQSYDADLTARGVAH
jgi:pyridoxine 4-dehydrogenase